MIKLRVYAGYILLSLLVSMSNAFADIYKWVDKDGQTHYSSTKPENRQADTIKSPPAVDPNETQIRIDALIKQQKIATEEKGLTEEERKLAAERRKKQQENCKIAKSNLQQYEDNPHARILDDDGEITYLREEERQANIKELKDYINELCQ